MVTHAEIHRLCRLAGSLICWLQHLVTVEDAIMHHLADEFILNIGIKYCLAFFLESINYDELNKVHVGTLVLLASEGELIIPIIFSID